MPYNATLSSYIIPCDSPTSNAVNRNLLISILALSIIGVIFNALTVFILSNLGDKKKNKFIQYIQIYSLTCLVVTCNSAGIFYIFIFFGNYANFYSLRTLIFYVCLPAFIATYTFSSILNIVIVYERIQMFKWQIKFLRCNPAWKISIAALLISLVFVLPSYYISFQIKQENRSATSNLTTPTYSFDLSDFLQISQLKIIFLVLFSLKCVIFFLIELVFNMNLIKCLTNYYQNRPVYQYQARPERYKKKWKNNLIILVICFLSNIHQIASLLSFFFSILDKSQCIKILLEIPILIFTFKHALNFFILVVLNTHFRKYFLNLFPKWNWNNIPNKSLVFSEHVNKETCTTKL